MFNVYAFSTTTQLSSTQCLITSITTNRLKSVLDDTVVAVGHCGKYQDLASISAIPTGRILPPKNWKQLKHFLGMINYYRDMWAKRSHVLAPLSALASPKAKWEWTQKSNWLLKKQSK